MDLPIIKYIVGIFILRNCFGATRTFIPTLVAHK